MEKPVLLERQDHTALLTLNRPVTLNALTFEMADELAGCLAGLSRDPGVKTVIITGAGRAFCAGGDLRWVAEFPGGAEAAFHRLAGRFHAAIIEIARMTKPVIAAVNGPAAGAGFSLALACDFRLLARSARLIQAYTSSGLSIDGGGTFFLPRLVGTGRALEIATFDPAISAEQALAWGLALKVVDENELLAHALALASDLARRSLSSFARSKRLLLQSLHTPLETQLENERESIASAGGHPDGEEGVRAFLEKRPPRFS